MYSSLNKEIQTIKGLTLNYDEEEDDNASGSLSTAKSLTAERLVDNTKRDPLTGSLLPSEKAKLLALIDRWEEPDRQSAKLVSTFEKDDTYIALELSQCLSN